MDGPEPAFSLSLAGGRALVVCRGQRLGPLRLVRLEMDVPGVRFPLDLAGGPKQFRRRWCQVRSAQIEVHEDDLRGQFRSGAAAGLGFERVDLALRPSGGVVFGTACVEQQSADFCARLNLEASGEREVRLSLAEFRIYGPLALPAPLLASTLLSLARVDRPAGDAREATLFEVELRPLDDLLENLLPRVGWRVPDRRRSRLVGLDVRDRGVLLTFSEADGKAAIAESAVESRRDRRRRPGLAQEQLARGDLEAAATVYREQLLESPDDLGLIEDLIGILIPFHEGREEVGRLAERALAVHAGFVPAVLALGVLAERDGRRAEAARRYEQIAALLDPREAPEEHRAARRAAARAYEPDEPLEAVSRLEAIARDADDPEALAALERIYRRLGRSEDCVRVLQRRVSLATEPGEIAALRIALGRERLVSLEGAERAKAEFEFALDVAPDSVDALSGLAEALAQLDEPRRAVAVLDRLTSLAGAQRRTAVVVDAELRCALLLEPSNPEEAVARLERAAHADPTRGDVLLRLAGLLARRGRTLDALETYESAIAVLPGESHASPLLEIARLRAVLDDPAATRAAIRRALDREQPREVENELLDMLLRFAENDPQEAEKILARIVERATTPERRSSALLKRGRLLGEVLGRAGEACEVLEAAARAGAHGSLDALHMLADHLEIEGNAEALRGTLERLLSLADVFPAAVGPVHLRLAQLAEQGGDLAQQKAHLTAAAVGETEKEALSMLVHLLETAGDEKGEERALGQLLRIDPDNKDALRRRAEVLERLGRVDEARTHVETLLRLSPEAERAALLFRLAEIAGRMGEARQAFARYREALAAGLDGPSARRSYECLRMMALERQDWDLSARLARGEAEDASVGLNEAERVALLLEAAGLWRDRLNRPQDAESCLRRALDHISDHDGALAGLEELFRRRGERHKVAEVLERRSQGRSSDPDRQCAVLIQLGDLRAELGQPDAARYAYLRCLAVDPAFAPALLALGRAALARGDSEDARHHLEKAAASEAHKDEALVARRLLAEAANAEGRAEDEVQALRSLLEIEEEPKERFRIASRIGALRDVAGQSGEALEAYRRALESQPEHVPTLWAMARLLGEAGQAAEQASALERLLELPDAPEVPDAERLLATLRDVYRDVPEAALSDPEMAKSLAEDGKLEELAGLYAEEATGRVSGPGAAALSAAAARLYEGPLRNVEAAAVAWLQAARTDPAAAGMPASRAAALFVGSGEPKLAVEAADMALASSPPDEAELRWTRAEALWALKRKDEAIADLRAVVSSDPSLFAARARLGEALLESGDAEAAVAHLAAAGEGLADSRIGARCAMRAAEALEELGRTEEAVMQWGAAATRVPGDPAPLRALLRLAEENGDFERVADLAPRAAGLESDPGERATLLLTGARALEAADRADEAYRMAREALALDRGLEEARLRVRRGAEQRGDWRQLAAFLEEEARGAGHGAARARKLLELGRLLEPHAAGEAAAAYERAAKADPDLADAHEALLRVHTASESWSDAARAAEALAQIQSGDEETRLTLHAGRLRLRAGERDAARLLFAYAGDRPGVSGDAALVALAGLAEDAAQRRQVGDLARSRLEDWPDEATKSAWIAHLRDELEKIAGTDVAEGFARELEESLESPIEELVIDAIEPDPPGSRFADGERAEAAGQPLVARAAYARVLQEDPDHVAALDALADLAFRDGDFSLAGALYARLAGRGSRVAPDDLSVRLGTIAEARGEPGAEGHYRDALRSNPGSCAALEALARLLASAGDSAGAVDLLGTLLDVLPPDDVAKATEVRATLADLLYSLGDEENAHVHYAEVLRHDPSAVPVLERIVDLHESAGRIQPAAEALERLAAQTGDAALRAERLCRLAALYDGQLGDAERAIDALLRAADVAPDPGPALLALMARYWDSGDLEGVAGVAAEIVRAVGDPGPVGAARLAIALAVRDRLDEARHHLAGSLLEVMASELSGASERGIDVGPAIGLVAPTVEDRAALVDALRALGTPGAEAILEALAPL